MYELTEKSVHTIADRSNMVMTDKNGLPSIMVKIPKLRMRDLIPGGSDNVHPAFMVGGVEKDYICISKYQNIVIDGVACSLPLEFPTTGVNYDEAKSYCEKKGRGWHLMTNAEYSLLALLALKTKTLPNGNNNYGSDINNPKEQGIVDDKAQATATGSGTLDWSHTHTNSGIYDLNGNVSEWVAGLRVKGGQIQVMLDNNAAATGYNTGAESTLWRPLKPDGSTGENGETSGTLYYDYKEEESRGGDIEITDAPSHPQTSDNNYGQCTYGSLYNAERPEPLTALGIASRVEGDYRGDTVSVSLLGERVARRGGCFLDKEKAGIFNLDLTSTRNYKGETVGFRCCYIP